MFQIKWLWHNLKGYKKLYVFALFLSLVCQCLYLTTPYFGREIIDNFISSPNALDNLSRRKNYFWLLVGAMVGFTVLRNLLQYICNMTYEKSSQGSIYRIRNHLYRRIGRQDADFYDKFRTGDLMTRLTGDLDMVRHTMSWVIRGAFESLFLFTASIIYFFTINVKMTFLLLAVLPFIIITSALFDRVAGPAYVKLREKLSKMNTAAQENISGNRVVKAFAREDYEIDKFQKTSEEFSDANKNASLLWLKYFPFMEFFANALSVVMLLGGGIFLINGSLSMGEFVAISWLIWAIAQPVRNLGIYINDFRRFMASAAKIIELYYARPLIVDREDAVENDEKIKGNIEFKNVSFSFGGKQVLKDINFKINAGETVAIMGETGSGKTSLINLIPRFYDCKNGEVLIDGVNVRMRKLKDLRENIGMATQDVLLFSDTIDGNIAYGNSQMTENDVHKYAKLAAADEFIMKMPKGYDTVVGERGVGLSGGQKQRISLARALAIKPSILILDDTTSAVDMETEKYIQHSLRNLDFECTKIIIAQRISSTKDADKIIILSHGEITECGTHEELIAKKGYYYDVYKLQGGEE